MNGFLVVLILAVVAVIGLAMWSSSRNSGTRNAATLADAKADARRVIERLGGQVINLTGICDRRDAQCAREGDDSVHDSGSTCIDSDLGDEVATELNFVNRQVAQVPQCRVAAAEVVDRDGHPLPTQFGQNALRRFDITQNKVVGDFHGQCPRCKAARLERTGDALRQLSHLE